jgi:AraC-like DNA-binding protein
MSHRCQSILLGSDGRRVADVAHVSAELEDGHAIPEHSHPEDQLLFAAAGVMTLTTEEGLWVVPPLRAVWIPAKTMHSVAISGRVSMRTLYFLPKLARSFPDKCMVINVSSLLRELILHACTIAKLRKEDPAERRIVEMILDQLNVVESIPLQLPHPVDSRATRVARTLFANPGDPRTLEKLCMDCGASKRTIQRLFLAETKMTFHKWRQQLRLLHAMQRLAAGDKVTSAALEAGYNSTSAFISMFRKQLGTTPTRYLQGKIVRGSGTAVRGAFDTIGSPVAAD